MEKTEGEGVCCRVDKSPYAQMARGRSSAAQRNQVISGTTGEKGPQDSKSSKDSIAYSSSRDPRSFGGFIESRSYSVQEPICY